MLFIHNYSGSDTTSSFFNHGKKTVLDIIKKYEKELSKKMLDFYDGTSSKETLELAGKICCRPLYGFKPLEQITLNAMRLTVFCKTIHKKNRKTAFKLSILPSTSHALYQHSLRVFFQVQTWLGRNDLNPLEFGWQMSESGCIPITTTEKPLPDELMEKINCACRKECGTNICSCRSKGQHCSFLCRNCNSKYWSNISTDVIKDAIEETASDDNEEQESIEIDSNANEDEAYSSTDNFLSDSSTNTVDESDLDVYYNSMKESVTGLEEENYDSD